ncbi:MAG: hypothetical protein ACT4PJ_10520 [Gemmatimonadaceae bacterium]
MLPRHHAGLSRIALFLAITASGSMRAHAQGPAPEPRTSSAADKGWRATPSIRVETEYDDNVFLLSPGRRNELDAPAEDATPGDRFASMHSPGDLITTMQAGLGIKGAGVGGRALELTADVRYELYARNADRRNVRIAFAAEQALPRGKRLRLRASVTPSYFAKNYLGDAVDRDLDGDIAPDERVYEAGTYSETAVELDYRLRLAKSTKRHPFGAALQPSVGYYARTYEAPFSGRDMSGPTAGLKLLMDVSPRAGLDVEYEFASLIATPARQVMILDESAFGRDFNGNGMSDDAFARAFEMSDRSRTEHAVAVSFRYEMSARADVELGAERRSRRFSSGQPFDVAHNGRSDARTTFGGELSIKLARGVRLVAGGEVASQRINRENDPGSTGEIADYDKHRTRVGLSYRF